VSILSNLVEKIPAQRRLGRLLRFPLRLIPRSTVVRVRSGLNRGMKWIVGASTHSCWLGIYEPQKQAAILRFIKPGMKVLDIGANGGFYTLAFARLVGDQGHVWAFEPLAGKVEYLLRHVSMNSLHNVDIVQAAVADKQGMARLQVTSDGSMGSLTSEGVYRVPTVSLDDLISANVISDPAFIKMDVEGAETMVLSGASKLLARRRAIVFLACHGPEQRRNCSSILREHGYRIFDLNGCEQTRDVLDIDEVYAVPAKA